MPDLVITAVPPAAFGLSWIDKGAKKTPSGPRRLYEASPTEAFSAAWRASKGPLRETGYGFTRDDRTGDWRVCYWARPSAEEEAAQAAAAAEAVAASRATDAEVEIPAPEGRTYLPYQRAGIAYAMARAGTLIGDEMGLGKTIQAIGVLNAGQAKRVLIACPASLKLNWKRELAAWMVADLPVHVVTGGKGAFPDVTNGGVVVVNYDVLHGYEAQVRSVAWDLFVADEAHMLKSKKARRTRAVFGGPKIKTAPAVSPIAAKRRLLLTGTPMSNRPIELHPLLAYLDAAEWCHFMAFAKKYCNAHQTRFGWDLDGASNLDELQDKLRATVMVRRLKADVLSELPAKVRQVVPLPAESAAVKRLLKSEEAAYEAWEKLQAAGSASAAAAFAELSRLREQVGLAKVPLLAEHILRDDGPVVAFAYHHSVVQELAKLLRGEGRRVAVMTGDMPVEHRQSRVDMFQRGQSDVILGTLGAMGVGHTLTQSAHVIIGELDWVPANLTQAEDRCHRIGQRGSVHIEHLVYEGSLDSRLVEVVVGKQAVLDAALDDRPEEVVTAIQDTGTDAPATAPSMAEVTAPSRPGLDEAGLREIEARAEVEAAERADRRAQAQAAEEARQATARATDDEVRTRLKAALGAAGWGLDAGDHDRAERLASDEGWRPGDRTRAQVLIERLQGYVDRAAERVGAAEVPPEDLALVADPEIRAIVLQGCRHLSGLDADRAAEDNGVGWSKTTSWTGHWIAGHEALDDQAAAVGLGLLRIHQRQLDEAIQQRLFGAFEKARKTKQDKVDHAEAGPAVEIAVEPVAPIAAPVPPEGPDLDSEPKDRILNPMVPAVEPIALAPEIEPEAALVVEDAVTVEEFVPRRDPKLPKVETAENVAARARLVAVGEAMYGPRWQTDLARDLGVADRTMRRWDSGHTPIPGTLWADIAVAARRRRDALDAVIANLGHNWT